MGKIKITNQTAPDTPATGITEIYVDSTSKKLTTKDDTGTVTNYGAGGGGGVTDHTALTSIGTNTHAQIDTHIALGNEHIDWTQSGVGTIHASNYVNTDTTDHTAFSNIGTNTHAQIDTHIASTANPHNVDKTDVGLTNVEDIKNNFAGTVAPTTTDDTGSGYSVGSEWIDTVGGVTYQCTDNTSSAAVWVETANAATVGDIAGPLSSTDNAIVRYNGATGKVVQDSLASVDDLGNILAGSGTISAAGIGFLSDPDTGFYLQNTGVISMLAGGEAGLSMKYVNSSSANIGFGLIPGVSVTEPFELQRSVSVDAYAIFQNQNTGTNAGFYLRVGTTSQRIKVGCHRSTNTTDAYAGGRAYIESDNNGAGLAIIGEDADDTIQFYSGGKTDADRVLEVHPDLTLEFTQEITTPVTNPATGGHKLYFKSNDNMYSLNDAGEEINISKSSTWNPVSTDWKVYWNDFFGYPPASINFPVGSGSLGLNAFISGTSETWTTAASPEVDRIGVQDIGLGTSVGAISAGETSSEDSTFRFGDGRIKIGGAIKLIDLPAAGEDMRVFITLGDNVAPGLSSNCMSLTTFYSQHSTNWVAHSNGVSSKHTDTTIAFDTNWINLEVDVASDLSTVKFYINGTLVYTETDSAYIPVAGSDAGFSIGGRVGTVTQVNHFYVDWAYMAIKPDNARGSITTWIDEL